MDNNNIDDLTLLRGWQMGDAQAGEALFEKLYPTLLRFFQAKAHRAAEDLVQDTMLACLECHHKFRESSSFKSYLFGIARNKLSHYYRGSKVVNSRDAQDIVEEISVEDIVPAYGRIDTLKPPAEAYEKSLDLSLLALALKKLPLQAQEVLQMTFWDSHTGPEIADMASIPLDTSYSRLRRAKEKLRSEFEKLKLNPQKNLSESGSIDLWAVSIAKQLLSDHENVTSFTAVFPNFAIPKEMRRTA